MVDEKQVKIKDMRMLITPHPTFVHKNADADAVAKSMLAEPLLREVYVVDDDMKLLGVITLNALIKHEFADLIPDSLDEELFSALEFVGKKTAEELMTAPVYVQDTDSLKTAFVKMYERNLDSLPVVDSEHQLTGTIDMLELLMILIEQKEKQAGRNYLELSMQQPFHPRYM